MSKHIPIQVQKVADERGYEIFLSCSESLRSKDWIFIELQGTLESSSNGTKDGQQIGTFRLSEKVNSTLQLKICFFLFWNLQNVPTLQIGNSLLEGKQVDLSKHLAVTKRILNEKMELQHSLNTEVDRSVQLQVVAVIRSKYLFKMRPKILTKKWNFGTSGQMCIRMNQLLQLYPRCMEVFWKSHKID